MHYFSTLFGKELYMFPTDLLSIIRSLSTVFTAIGICQTVYVDWLQATSLLVFHSSHPIDARGPGIRHLALIVCTPQQLGM